MDLLYKAL